MLSGQPLGLAGRLRLVVGQRYALAAPFTIDLMTILALAKTGSMVIGLLGHPDQVDVGHFAGFNGHHQGTLSNHLPGV